MIIISVGGEAVYFHLHISVVQHSLQFVTVLNICSLLDLSSNHSLGGACVFPDELLLKSVLNMYLLFNYLKKQGVFLFPLFFLS